MGLLRKHDEPKSITFIADLFGTLNNIFSGFKSQCIISTSGLAKNANDFNTCLANFLINVKDTPLKFVLRNNSYKLNDKCSNTKQV